MNRNTLLERVYNKFGAYSDDPLWLEVCAYLSGGAPKKSLADPRPELCHHDDSSWCTEECAAKVRALRAWMSTARTRIPDKEN